MPYTMQDFRRDYVKEHLKDLTVEERLHGVPAEEIEKYLQAPQKANLTETEEPEEIST